MKVLIAQSCLNLRNPWTLAIQAPLSMKFSRQETWSGLPFPSPGDLPDSGIEPGSPALQADFLLTELQRKGSPIHKLVVINLGRIYEVISQIIQQATVGLRVSFGLGNSI